MKTSTNEDIPKMESKSLYTVLVVEDDEGISHLIRKNLRRAGFRTEAVVSGAEAINWITKNPHTLLLLDYTLPDMTGKEVIETLKKRNSSVPFIIITGHGDERLAVEMMKLGAQDYVIKDPAFLDVLPSALDRVVDQLSTEKKLVDTENALQESEERYRSLINDVLDTSAVGIVILDSDFSVVWVNQTLERYTNIRREDIVGKDMRQLINDQIKGMFEDPDAFALKVLSSYDNNTYIKRLKCHVLPEGERRDRWFEYLSQPIRSGLYEGGRIEHYTDITEHQHAWEAVKLASTELIQIFQNAVDGICVIDKNFNILRTNRAFLRILGINKNESIGKKCYDVIGGALCHTPNCVLTQILQGEEQIEYDVVKQHSSGNKISCILTSTPFRGPDNELIGIVVNFKDITERKHVENLQRVQRDIGLALTVSNDINEVSSTILEAVCQIEGIDCGGFHLVDEVDGGLNLISHRGLSSDFIKEVSRYEADSPNTQAIMQGEILFTVINDTLPPPEIILKEGLRAGVCIPLKSEGKVLGAFNFVSHTLDEFPESTRNALEALASLLEIVVSRMQAEEARRESESRYQTLVDNIDLGINLISSDFEILMVNQAVCKMVHKDVKDIVNRKCYQEFEKRTDICSHCPGKIAMATGRSKEVETVAIRDDGSTFDVRSKAYPIFGKDNQAIGFVEVVEDISERKRAEKALIESEERYRKLFEEAQDGIVLADAETGVIIDCNRAGAALVGREKSELIGQHQKILHPPDEITDEFSESFKKHLGECEGQVLETHVITSTGEVKDVAIKANLLHVGDRRLLQGIFRDVTECKRAEKEREKLIHELQDALAKVKTLSGLVPICSHCKKVRDDKGYWNQVEDFVHAHSEAEFSHSICPDCLVKHYPDFPIRKEEEQQGQEIEVV